MTGMETVQTSNLMRIYGPAWSVAGKRPNKLEQELIVAIIAAWHEWHHITKAEHQAALVEAIQDDRLL